MATKTTSYAAILGQILQARRKERGLEQKVFAELLHISQATLSRIENGQLTLSVPQLIQAAEVLEINPNDIMKDIADITQHLRQENVAVLDKDTGKDNTKTFLAGAALGALLLLLLSRK
ncbi:MAG: helix-turn-helix domain-containing protein [Proteobacteria bacterium]|nr:helix-turn-helix domain-containing protein [Pseudomonadota bacterium]